MRDAKEEHMTALPPDDLDMAEMARAAIAECEKDRAELEAQFAAMRAALEFYAAKGTYQWDLAPDPASTPIPGTAPIDCDQGDQAVAALSPDAGRKVLDVVRAMQELIKVIDLYALEMSSPEIGGHDDIPPHQWHEEWLHNARQALSALGWEP